MLDRNPLAGPPVSGKDTDQPYPRTDRDRTPGAGLAAADARYISGEVLAITGKTSSR